MSSKHPNEPMENSIVQDFENLKVLTAYDFLKMDELVSDLTNALEHTSKAQKPKSLPDRAAHTRKVRKKAKKRKGGFIVCNISEASESSLDEALKDYMENITQQSDSDDLIVSAKKLPSLANHAVYLVESDSYTENFSPLRPNCNRRRRKFKRMVVENSTYDIDTDIRHRKVPSKVKKKSVSESAMEDDILNIQPTASTSQAEVVIPGKRKRGMRYGNSFDLLDADAPSNSPDGDCNMEQGATKGESQSTSSLSSSESEGIYTNDEGRDGDDEHSDFYYDTSSECGIQGIIPWWEESGGNPEQMQDPMFQKILTGSFEHMSKAAQRSFKARLKFIAKPGREYRSARRRLKDRKLQYSISKFIAERQQWTQGTDGTTPVPTWQQHPQQGSTMCHNSSNGQSGDNKRQRRTPPTTPIEDLVVGGEAAPIPESNIGNQILQTMGWNPGSGLGADGAGIVNPITAVKRSGRRGLGANPPTPP